MSKPGKSGYFYFLSMTVPGLGGKAEKQILLNQDRLSNHNSEVSITAGKGDTTYIVIKAKSMPAFKATFNSVMRDITVAENILKL